MVSSRASRILCALSFSLLAAASASGAGFFAPTGGPDGRSAVDVAAAPNGNLYATVQPPGVYVLGFGSSRWARLPDPPVVFSNVEVAPNGLIWLFGYGSLLVTIDGGTWATPGTVPAVTSLTFDAAGRALAGTAAGLYRSADDGVTWTRLALPAQPVSVIEVGSASTWVAFGTQLYRSDDQGTSWSPAATLPSTTTALAEHPDGGLYAGIANIDPPACVAGGLYRITAGGNVSPLGLAAFHIRDILVQSDNTILVSAGDPCWYYQACGGCNQPGIPYDCGVSGVYRSTNSGASWTLATTAAGIPTQLVTRNDGALFTAAQAASCDICWTVPPGVLTSGDGGASWAPKNQGLGKSAVSWIAAPPNGDLVLAANSTSVYASSDRGANWTLFRDATPVLCAQVFGSLGFAALGPISFAVEEGFPLTVYRVFPGSQSLVTPGPSGTGFRDIVVTESGALVVAAGSIYVASNPIVSGFSQIPFPLAPTGIGHLAAGPGQRLAGTTASNTYLSNNAGQFWTSIANVGDGRLAFSTDGFTLYVAQGLNPITLWRLRESNNWLPEPVTAFASPPTAIHDLLVDPVGAVYVIAQFNYTSAGHILRLSPGAATWQELDVLDYATGIALASDGYLYVSGDGVWRSASPVGTITDVGPQAQVVDALSTAPNPLGEHTSIHFRLAQADDVHLAVYDVRGRLVSTLLADRALASGSHDVVWQPLARTPNGVYVYRLHTSIGERRGRMLLLR